MTVSLISPYQSVWLSPFFCKNISTFFLFPLLVLWFRRHTSKVQTCQQGPSPSTSWAAHSFNFQSNRVQTTRELCFSHTEQFINPSLNGLLAILFVTVIIFLSEYHRTISCSNHLTMLNLFFKPIVIFLLLYTRKSINQKIIMMGLIQYLAKVLCKLLNKCFVSIWKGGNG